MTADQILKLADVVIELAATELNKGETADVLLQIMQSCEKVQQQNAGQPLNPSLITPEEEV